jgi:hypothetical protein
LKENSESFVVVPDVFSRHLIAQDATAGLDIGKWRKSAEQHDNYFLSNSRSRFSLFTDLSVKK